MSFILYYPFGLTLAGISSKPPASLENKHRYNGIEQMEDLGLNEYDAFYRNLDPQTGRWWQIDPKIENGMENTSPYASMFNDPILKSDPLGDEPDGPGDGWLSRAWNNFKEAVSVTADQLNLPAIYDGTVGTARTFNTYVNPLTPVVELTTGKSVESNLTENKSRWTAAGEILMIALPVVKAEGSLTKLTEKVMTSSEEKVATSTVKPTEAYNRTKHYGKTPTAADRKALGANSSEVVDHKTPLVQHYYEGDGKGGKPGYAMTPAERKVFANDRSNMQVQPNKDSQRQGAEMSRYSRQKKKEHNL